MSRGDDVVTLAEVLARVHAPAEPHADALAAMSPAEVERALAALGVDPDREIAALGAAVSGDRDAGPAIPEPEDALDLDPARAEAELRALGVDVDAYLARARALIDGRLARLAPPVRPARRPPVPRALAAGIAAIAVVGVSFTLVRDRWPEPAPSVATAGLESAPSRDRPAPVADRDDDRGAASSETSNRAPRERAVAPGEESREATPGDGLQMRIAADRAAEPAAGSPPPPEPAAEQTARFGEDIDRGLSAALDETAPVAEAERVAPPASAIRSEPSRRRAAKKEAGPAATPLADAGIPAPQSLARARAAPEPSSYPASPASAGMRVVDRRLAAGEPLRSGLEEIGVRVADVERILALLPDTPLRGPARVRVRLDADRLTTLAIERPGRPTLRLERAPGGRLERTAPSVRDAEAAP